MTDLPQPHERETAIGFEALETRLREQLAAGAMANGWLLAGPKGAGKATLAYRLARAILDPGALKDPASLEVDANARVFRLIAGRAHPDLFVAERAYDEKKDTYASEISVDIIRKLNSFMNRTAAGGGWRVAIVDCADDMNRNAANALLKSLEEPPAKTAILLVAHAPGRLLATIRSRCRRIEVRPAPLEAVAALVEAETGLGKRDALGVAAAAHGLPGYALSLAAGEGAEAVGAAEKFIRLAAAGDDVSALAAKFAGRQGAALFEPFARIVLDEISAAARASAAGEAPNKALANAHPLALTGAHGEISALFARGDAVNVDRAQMLFAAARILRTALTAEAA